MDALKAALEKKMMEMKMRGPGIADEAGDEDMHDADSLDGSEKAPDIHGNHLSPKIDAAQMGHGVDMGSSGDDDKMEILKALSGGDSPLGRGSSSLSEKVGEKAKAKMAMMHKK